MAYHYKVFNLEINSEVKLDALDNLSQPVSPFIVLKERPLQRPEENLPETIYSKHFIYNSQICFQDLETNGAYFIEKSKDRIEVTLDFRSTTNPNILLSYFYGTGLSSILHLIGKFAIHASGVLVDQKLNLFCGESGIGKSTLAVSLKAKGFPFFSDDKCVLFKNEESNIWEAFPSLKIIRLWDQTIEEVETNPFIKNPTPVLYKENKYQFQVKQKDFISTNQPVGRIYILSIDDSLEKPEIIELSGIEKMTHLQSQVFRRSLIKGFQKEKDLWEFTSKLSKEIPIFLIKRPKRFSIEETSNFIEKEISKPINNKVNFI